MPPKDVVGHRLWDFVQDLETQLLYKELFKRVREDQTLRTILFRCDSPSERRFLKLFVESLPDANIKLTSKILRTEPRVAVKLLAADTARSTDVVTLCSMCKKIKILLEKWVEIEEGLAHLKLFETDKMPQLSHGLCPACYETAMAELGN